jgi:hypothetical protein
MNAPVTAHERCTGHLYERDQVVVIWVVGQRPPAAWISSKARDGRNQVEEPLDAAWSKSERGFPHWHPLADRDPGTRRIHPRAGRKVALDARPEATCLLLPAERLAALSAVALAPPDPTDRRCAGATLSSLDRRHRSSSAYSVRETERTYD